PSRLVLAPDPSGRPRAGTRRAPSRSRADGTAVVPVRRRRAAPRRRDADSPGRQEEETPMRVLISPIVGLCGAGFGAAQGYGHDVDRRYDGYRDRVREVRYEDRFQRPARGDSRWCPEPRVERCRPERYEFRGSCDTGRNRYVTYDYRVERHGRYDRRCR